MSVFPLQKAGYCKVKRVHLPLFDDDDLIGVHTFRRQHTVNNKDVTEPNLITPITSVAVPNFLYTIMEHSMGAHCSGSKLPTYHFP